jgi:hypothetical protein
MLTNLFTIISGECLGGGDDSDYVKIFSYRFLIDYFQ